MAKKLFLLMLSLLSSILLYAVPAIPTPVKVKQADGTIIDIMICGDEYGHFYTTTDGYIISKSNDGIYRYVTGYENGVPVLSREAVASINNRRRQTSELLGNISREEIKVQISEKLKKTRLAVSGSYRSKRLPAFPHKGEARGLVIMVQFNDKTFIPENTKEKINDMLNKPGYNEGKFKGSAYDYFTSQSKNRFKPGFDVYGPVTMDYGYKFYGQNDSNGNDISPHIMVREACEKLDGEIDFGKYDNNNDGYVDLVYIIYAGYGENSGADENTIWPHSSMLQERYGIEINLDGKKIDSYACSCELNGNEVQATETAGIGVFCHEFSHCLGLYDMYDTNGMLGGNGKGFGKYSIMDQGCYNNGGFVPCSFTALERMQAGWLTPDELDDKFGLMTLEDINSSNEAYIIYNPDNRNEYFLFENRQKNGWDEYIPGSGMMISHINYDEEKWESNSINTEDGKEGAVLIPANNVFYTSPENHLYPTESNSSFTDTSSPASVFSDGTPVGKPITGIKEVNGTITFTYMDVPLEKPVALEATAINGTGFTANWESVRGAEKYILTVIPFEEIEYPEAIINEDFSLFKAGSIDSPSNTDISSKLDEYTKVPGWNGRKVYQAGGTCKIGTSTAPGNLLTPKIRMPQSFRIIVDAKDYVTSSGKSDNAILSIATRIPGETEFLEMQTFPLTENMETYTFSSNKGDNNLFVQIGTGEKRCIVDNIIIVGENTMKAASEDRTTIEDIEDTSYKVTGLKTNYKYGYTVTAVAQDKVSETSDTIYVVTSASAIESEKVHPTVYADNGILYIQPASREMVSVYSTDGKCIKRGYVCSRTEIPLENGFYIVIINDRTFKILIQK